MAEYADIAINLDLSNVERLYDFENQEYVYPVAGEYDMFRLSRASGADPALKGASGADPALQGDKERQKCIASMYTCLRGKGLCETDISSAHADHKAREKALKSKTSYTQGHDSRFLPHRYLPVITPGQKITGHVMIDLKKHIKDAEKISLSLKGGARTLIRRHYGKSSHDHRGREMYVEESQTLWNRKQNRLHQGQHRFNFDFHVPASSRQSVPQLVTSGWTPNYAHIIYRLKVTIDKGCCCKCGNIVGSRPLWVMQTLDISALPPQCLSQFYEEKVFNTGVVGTAGKITCRVTLSKQAYVRGETAQVSLEIANGSQSLVDDVIAYWQIGGLYRSGTGCSNAVEAISTRSLPISGGPVSVDSVTAMKLNVPMEFHNIDSNLIPVGSLEDCTYIDVQYLLVVQLVRKGVKLNLKVYVPVWVGSVNSSSLAPNDEAATGSHSVNATMATMYPGATDAPMYSDNLAFNHAM